jgi:HicA toxin of bacterial toxin-antitoxin,
MNSKQAKTLDAVFATPVPKNIEWASIESLLVSVGCRVTEGAGARVRFDCRGVMLAVHRPHPRKEAKPYQVRAVREFLVKLEITP